MKFSRSLSRVCCRSALLLLIAAVVIPGLAWAQDAAEAAPEAAAPATPPPPPIEVQVADAALAGHNAWMLTSTALVLFMTAPGLAMFYGGLVRKKNVLGVIMQCVFLMGLMSVLWAV